MPHECTTCGRTFADGSKEMLSGCPDCGGNKFQFKPASRRSSAPREDDAGRDPDRGSPEAPDADTPTGSDRGTPGAPDADTPTGSDRGTPGNPDAGTPGNPDTGTPAGSDDGSVPDHTATADSPDSTPTGTRSPSPDRSESDAEVERGPGEAGAPSGEDTAQASARTDMVTPDELADAATEAGPPPEDVDGRVIEPQTDDRPGLDDLREELNSQFESIKIVSPGQYELNLMELYDRQEYIISLQEDGRYVIEVPDSWNGPEDA
jgi:hypothetical protein